LLAQRPLDRPPNPSADGHAVGIRECPDLLDRLRRETDWHVLRERSLGTATRRARRRLALRRIVVVLEWAGVRSCCESESVPSGPIARLVAERARS
jgi:hypothetical protein